MGTLPDQAWLKTAKRLCPMKPGLYGDAGALLKEAQLKKNPLYLNQKASQNEKSNESMRALLFIRGICVKAKLHNYPTSLSCT